MPYEKTAGIDVVCSGCSEATLRIRVLSARYIEIFHSHNACSRVDDGFDHDGFTMLPHSWFYSSFYRREETVVDAMGNQQRVVKWCALKTPKRHADFLTITEKSGKMS